MTKKKFLPHSFFALLLIGAGFALWALFNVARYPAFETMSPTDSSRLCFGFGLISLAVSLIILQLPKSDNELSNGVGKVIGWVAVFCGVALVVCSIMFLSNG
jgi:hypothetical protein